MNAEDPVGLLAMCAPEDEYDPEVNDLLSRSAAVTHARVREVFLEWFGKDTGRLDAPTVERIAAGLEALRKGTGEHP